VISHNYGRFLGEAIDSVLGQTLSPDEVLIIDDASTDETLEVASRYSDLGVQYTHVLNRSVWRNRILAADTLKGKWLLCLDADNTLHPEYLASAMKAATDPMCGVIYPSLQRFGEDNRLVDLSDPELPVSSSNYIDASAVYRREALLQAGLDLVHPDQMLSAEDWIQARRIISGGWTAQYNPVAVNYRVHGSNKHARRAAISRDHYDDAGLDHELITIVIPLAGRTHLWPLTSQWLDSQHWPRNQCRLVLIDNSHDAEFTSMVRQWVATSDYSDVNYRRDYSGYAGQADEPRTGRPAHDRQAHRTVAAIYNRAFQECPTDYLLTLEDDISPPLGAIEDLLRGMSPRVAAVTGAYLHRDRTRYLVWRGPHDSRTDIAPQDSGVEPIGGCGFGCLLIRRDVTKSLMLTTDGPTPFYDANACDQMVRMGWALAVNWSVRCDHFAEAL
jgi:glycosyltransferase involved in cell wall biosynthesis